MLRTLPATRDFSALQRLAAVAFFALLTVLSARVRIDFYPVPFTLQPLVVLFSGLVLGARDGALSQLAYITLIAFNLPVDTNYLGAAAFASGTGGFLVGFVPAAWTAGFLAQRGADKLWMRWLAGVAGLVVLYGFGCAWLLIIGRTPQIIVENVIRPLFALDLIKAFIAAGLTESGRALLKR
ncbi:MAG: biotin transporter BioY [bacterium]|nr:biotin transporter BioY [bacterium]